MEVQSSVVRKQSKQNNYEFNREGNGSLAFKLSSYMKVPEFKLRLDLEMLLI